MFAPTDGINDLFCNDFCRLHLAKFGKLYFRFHAGDNLKKTIFRLNTEEQRDILRRFVTRNLNIILPLTSAQYYLITFSNCALGGIMCALDGLENTSFMHINNFETS